MARVIVFGLQDFASLAHFYLRHDSEHEVAAFTVTRDFLPDGPSPEFEGRPVVPFEDLERSHPPGEFRLFAPMSARGMNRPREAIYLGAKGRGYGFISYVSSRATVFPGTPIGENCFILEDNTIQPFARIGDDVVLWSGNHVGHHSVVGDHAMFTSHVVLSGHCEVGPYCFLGVNATIRDGLRLGEGTLVAMGACVGRDTEPWSVYQGVPARRREVASTDVEL
jgi:sugar O-acyltransferase (sialic acid O-acetyltransferase NeuD family)